MPEPKITFSEIRYVIHSSHPRISAAELATELEDHISELNEYLRERYGDIKVEAQREESFPIDWTVAYLVLKFIMVGTASGVLKNIGSDAYDYLKGKVKNGSIQPADDDKSQKRENKK